VAARAEADGPRARAGELPGKLAWAEERVSRLVIAREEVMRVMEEPPGAAAAGGRARGRDGTGHGKKEEPSWQRMPRSRTRTCRRKADHGGSRHLLFTGPDGGHHRRGNYSRRVFRPACDGRHEPTQKTAEKLVIVDMDARPGRPVASWPLARPGEPWQPPPGNDNQKPVTEGTGTARCGACGRSVKWLASGSLVAHKVAGGRCPGSGGIPAQDPALAAWLPVKRGLTPHGLRHGKETWMIEDGIPEILAELSLGHEVPGMRGLYSHVSEHMRQQLKDKLQARWERSLQARFELASYSPVPTLDELLTPLRMKMGTT
jgi:hypothetical protein